MKTYKKKTVTVLDQTICDVCGKTCTDDFYNNHENATLEALWGYSSRSDGTKFEIHLCENCFYVTLGFLRDQRLQYIPTPEKDPLAGGEYNII